MSLSPQNYAESIGRIDLGNNFDDYLGSALVYLDHCKGERPGGFDGHGIREKDGMLWYTCSSDPHLFPPYPLVDKERKIIKTREELSKEAFVMVQKIREEYIKKQEESANGKNRIKGE